MKYQLIGISILTMVALGGVALAEPLGLPPVPIPKDNPQTPDKIKLGEKLFHDTRFSTTGQVSCATCHDKKKAFTDSPLSVSEGINQLKGTRNAPTVFNSAYLHTQFWDGREPDLEGQSAQPFINPVEMGLTNHDPILKIVRTDPEYVTAFDKVFGKNGEQITMKEVTQAIASFERTVLAGDSPFDRYQYGENKNAMNEAAIRGFKVFTGQGRCVSCHTISQSHALFTDNRFHNLGIGFERIEQDVTGLATVFAKAKAEGTDVDVTVLTNKHISELGRFAVSGEWRDMGAFKTPTLRNIALTPPYMHDGSLQTLQDVVEFYNQGGQSNGFQSGGIRPLNLSDSQKIDLISFMIALTSMPK